MIYLDNSSTTKPYEQVLASFMQVNERYFGNPSSLHQLGSTASTLLEKARQQAASILGVRTEEIIFTSGGTESNNLAIKGIVKANRHKGNHLITTQIEHPSVRNVFEELKEDGFTVTYLPVNKKGIISIEDLGDALTNKTILVSIMHVNNETGSIQPIQEAGALIKKQSRAFFHVDAIQSFGKVPLEIYNHQIDLLSISAHKFHGLKGSGLLFNKRLNPLTAQNTGGNQESGLRSGTENVAGAVSMAKAMRMVTDNKEGLAAMEIYREQLLQFFSSEPYVRVISPKIGAPHILNVAVPKLKGEVIVHALEEKGIYVSTTSACSSKSGKMSRTIQSMGFTQAEIIGTIRISMSHDTSQKEVDQLQKVWSEIIPPLMKGI
ncbi:cysteine desulfurase [Jeotgalibacillus sp. S-D1]|uniref:cysteine desulfurase family protein n=1 Tax=Jeotgalibacillus sp. S-D1 TaxID=2552189 RepID=UPI00105A6D5F|nr:cysteine desulfurase family protein [Jeotgalibacillus sp. S-D1]TDL34304.1 cysteine desulfurase [Jeotgalibacillus sp. S-D1]